MIVGERRAAFDAPDAAGALAGGDDFGIVGTGREALVVGGDRVARTAAALEELAVGLGEQTRGDGVVGQRLVQRLGLGIAAAQLQELGARDLVEQGDQALALGRVRRRGLVPGAGFGLRIGPEQQDGAVTGRAQSGRGQQLLRLRPMVFGDGLDCPGEGREAAIGHGRVVVIGRQARGGGDVADQQRRGEGVLAQDRIVGTLGRRLDQQPGALGAAVALDGELAAEEGAVERGGVGRRDDLGRDVVYRLREGARGQGQETARGR